MRPLSPSLQAAIGQAAPLLMLELIDWAQHYAAVYTGGPSGRTSACLAGDGSLVQAYSDLLGHVYARRVSDPTQASWGAWTALTAAANTSGVVCCANLGSAIAVLWPDAATANLFESASSDNGQTWSTPQLLFDAGGAVQGIAADGLSGQIFVLYAAAPNAYRVALWTLGAGWVKADWSNGDSYTGAGLGALRRADGSYVLAAALQGVVTSGTALQVCTYDGAWSALDTVVPADLSAGVTLQDPHVTGYDGQYHLSYGVVDSGAVSGLASARATLAHSLDAVHWSDPLPDGNSYAHGAVALKHAAGYLLAAPDTAALAAPYSSTAAQYRDCTPDVSRLEVVQKDGEPARLVVTLQNDQGQYAALPALRANARLRLSLGYAGAGLTPTHLCYAEEWSFATAAGESEVVITAADATAWLDRQSRSTLVYANQTVGWLARELLARAGLLAVALPTTAQFTQLVPTFAVAAGATWRAALLRLSRLYGFEVAARAQPDGSDSIAVVEKSPADAPVWSYGSEIELATLARNADRANHVLVFGASATGGPPLGEAWDWADVADTGQERYLHVVEPQITTRSGAGTRATLELNAEMRLARSGSLSVALHPGLEVWDVITTGGGVIPATTMRIATLHHLYEPHPGAYDLVLTLEGQ